MGLNIQIYIKDGGKIFGELNKVKDIKVSPCMYSTSGPNRESQINYTWDQSLLDVDLIV